MTEKTMMNCAKCERPVEGEIVINLFGTSGQAVLKYTCQCGHFENRIQGTW